MNMEERLAEVERRLGLLEQGVIAESPNPRFSSKAPVPLTEPLVAISVSNKRYVAGDYENHIWFDCTYTLSASSKPTRAIKGNIVFGDIFGTEKFRIQVTINDPLQPDKLFSSPGLGFTYNQFMAEHQWMLVTELKDMKFSFVALNIIHIDGTSYNLS